MTVEARLERLFGAFRVWCVAWGISRLPRDATIEFEDTLGAALGICDVQAGRIALNAVLLLPENEALLHETLCHEAAHLVAYLRYGRGIAEHGPEWEEFMRRVGYPPRTVIPFRLIQGLKCAPPEPARIRTRGVSRRR